ncbi:MAG: toxin-antitoxin system YwqK family antitoxin [Cyclobacteriaceae bacterium]
MKKILLIIIGFSFYACNESSSDIDLVNAYADAPPGSQRIPYPEKEGLVKVIQTGRDGEVLQEGDYLNGIREGYWTEYHPNGIVKTMSNFKNGKLHGAYISLDSRGNITEKFSFLEGLKTGTYHKYDRGKISVTMEYQNDLVHGNVQRFYPNGNIQEESNYASGILHGKARWYDQQGNVTIEYTYENGDLIDKGENLNN